MTTRIDTGIIRAAECDCCRNHVPAVPVFMGTKGHRVTLRLCADCEKELLRFLLMRALNDGRI